MSRSLASARSANLISNAQVTGARAARTIRRPRRQVLTTIKRLAVEGQASLVSPLRAIRNVAGDCTAPVQQTEIGGTYARPILDTFARCRSCEACLRFRRRQWAAKAVVEIERAPRSWMVTLTLTPEAHFRMSLLSERSRRLKGVRPEDMTAAEDFRGRCGEIGKEVTRWLKRARAQGADLRYLCVYEAHKSGLPHVHLLVHDYGGTTYRRLCETWRLGFAHAKLVEGSASARYVTKYLTKSVLARVRASQHYGQEIAPSGKAA